MFWPVLLAVCLSVAHGQTIGLAPCEITKTMNFTAAQFLMCNGTVESCSTIQSLTNRVTLLEQLLAQLNATINTVKTTATTANTAANAAQTTANTANAAISANFPTGTIHLLKSGSCPTGWIPIEAGAMGRVIEIGSTYVSAGGTGSLTGDSLTATDPSDTVTVGCTAPINVVPSSASGFKTICQNTGLTGSSSETTTTVVTLGIPTQRMIACEKT